MSSRNVLMKIFAKYLPACSIFGGNKEVDKMEVTLEVEYLKILALYQPAAIDLCVVIAVTKINNDLA